MKGLMNERKNKWMNEWMHLSSWRRFITHVNIVFVVFHRLNRLAPSESAMWVKWVKWKQGSVFDLTPCCHIKQPGVWCTLTHMHAYTHTRMHTHTHLIFQCLLSLGPVYILAEPSNGHKQTHTHTHNIQAQMLSTNTPRLHRICFGGVRSLVMDHNITFRG